MAMSCLNELPGKKGIPLEIVKILLDHQREMFKSMMELMMDFILEKKNKNFEPIVAVHEVETIPADQNQKKWKKNWRNSKEDGCKTEKKEMQPCFECQQMHWRRNCPKLKKWRNSHKKNGSNAVKSVMEAQTEVAEVEYDANIEAELSPTHVHIWNPVEKPTTAEILNPADVVAVDLDKLINEFVLESNDGPEQLNEAVNTDIGAVYWGKSTIDVVLESQNELKMLNPIPQTILLVPDENTGVQQAQMVPTAAEPDASSIESNDDVMLHTNEKIVDDVLNPLPLMDDNFGRLHDTSVFSTKLSLQSHCAKAVSVSSMLRSLNFDAPKNLKTQKKVLEQGLNTANVNPGDLMENLEFCFDWNQGTKNDNVEEIGQEWIHQLWKTPPWTSEIIVDKMDESNVMVLQRLLDSKRCYCKPKSTVIII